MDAPVADRWWLVNSAVAKIITHPAKLVRVEEACFDGETYVQLIVDDPSLPNLPSGSVRVDIEKI